MPPEPRLAIVATVQQAITVLLTTYEPAFLRFGYSLLSVILISNLMAIILQSLCAKLGIVTGRDLAQACRDHYSIPTVWAQWILCEVAIAACDLAEVVGAWSQLAFPLKAAILAVVRSSRLSREGES